MDRETGWQIWSPRDDNAMESPHVEQVTVGNKTDARSSIRGATRDMVVDGGGLVRVGSTERVSVMCFHRELGYSEHDE
jgi:hypothetical protein